MRREIRRLLFFHALVAACLASGTSIQAQTELPPVDVTQLEPSHLPYALETVRRFAKGPEWSMLPVDLENDGADELVFAFRPPPGSYAPPAVEVLDLRYDRVRWRDNFRGELKVSNFFADLDGDGKEELFVSEQVGDSLYFHILRSTGDTLLTIPAAVAPAWITRKWRCVATAEGVMDVNADGSLDLILRIETQYAYQPRGLRALDVRYRRWLWSYACGFAPRGIVLADVDGDGAREILVGSSAPGNWQGRRVNGTDDVHTYITVLDSLGRVRIPPRVVGGEMGSARFYQHDLNGDGEREILLAFRRGKTPGERSFVALFDGRTGRLAPKVTLARLLSFPLLFLDADRDGNDDVLVAWGDGTVEFRNGRLERVRSRRFLSLQPRFLSAADLNNDGEEEICLVASVPQGERVFVINRELEVLAALGRRVELPAPQAFVRAGIGEDTWLLLSPSGPDKCLLRFARARILPAAVGWRWVGYGFAGGALLMAIALGLALTLRTRRVSRRTLRAVFDSIEIGLLALDPEGRIAALNAGMQSLLGAGGEGVIGLPYDRALASAELAPLARLVASCYEGDRIHVDEQLTVHRRDGDQVLLVSVNPLPLWGSRDLGRLVAVRDVSALVQSQRAVAWAGMAQRLAHEIKTPLSTIRLSAQRLESECGSCPKGSGVTQKYLVYISEQVQRLQEMTDALLKFARVEEPVFEPVSVNGLIQECLESARVKLGRAVQVVTHLEPDLPPIRGDARQLLIALQNLIDNSLNAMRGRGTLTISTRLVQSLQSDMPHRPLNAVQIEISDTGEGIPDHLKQHLFQPFFSRSKGGTGMGLVIVRKIVEDHRGSIRIESEEGIGTTVFVTLPAAN